MVQRPKYAAKNPLGVWDHLSQPHVQPVSEAHKLATKYEGLPLAVAGVDWKIFDCFEHYIGGQIALYHLFCVIAQQIE